MTGYSDVLIGLQYGDEGKAKAIDLLADKYDIIARFNGGSNAGHTIEKGNIKLALHQVPSGVFYENKTLYVGSGCVVNIEKLTDEIKQVNGVGISLKGRFHISALTSVVQPHHIIIDTLTASAIGTTKNGIGPCYADRAGRINGERLLNIRMGDLVEDPDFYFDRIEENLVAVLKQFDITDYDVRAAIDNMKNALDNIAEFVERDTLFLEKQISSGKTVLMEGAQSFMLDVNKGTVPCVTSSNTLAGAAYTGGDLNPKYHRKTIGVAKAIMSRVGNGPFTPEFGGEESEEYCKVKKKSDEQELDPYKLLASENQLETGIGLRLLSDEYGASTGRPRRIGCFDLVQLNYAVKSNGIDEIFITKCDLLNLYSKTASNSMPVVSGYKLDDVEIDYVPASSKTYYRVKPDFEYLKTFTDDVSNATDKNLLPENLITFLELVEERCGCKVMGIGLGPKRDDYLLL